jgi:hypothetical protein
MALRLDMHHQAPDRVGIFGKAPPSLGHLQKEEPPFGRGSLRLVETFFRVLGKPLITHEAANAQPRRKFLTRLNNKDRSPTIRAGTSRHIEGLRRLAQLRTPTCES